MKNLTKLSVLMFITIVVSLSSCKKDENTSTAGSGSGSGGTEDCNTTVFGDGNDPVHTYGSFTDSRDGKVYKTIEINGTTWLAENLAFTGDNGFQENITDNEAWANSTEHNGWRYFEDKQENGNIYGVLYQKEAAKRACPDGWHLAIMQEWEDLFKYLGMTNEDASDWGTIGTNEGAKFAGRSDLWVECKLTKNEDFGTSGFTVIPAGEYYEYNKKFYGLGLAAAFWYANNSTNQSLNTISIDYDKTTVFVSNYTKSNNGLSIRCIKD